MFSSDRARKLVHLFCFLILVPLGSSATTLGLREVVATALERNPGLKAVEEKRTEVRGGVTEARAEALPQFSLLANWGQSRNPSLLNSPDFEDLIDFIGDFEPGTQELYNLGVEVSQPIYTFGKVAAAIDLSKVVVEAIDAQVETAQLDTALLAAETYFELLGARKSVEAIEIQRKSRKEALEVVEARFELGDATRLELLQARATVAQLEPDILAAEGLVRVSERNLRAILDLADDKDVLFGQSDLSLPEPPEFEEALAWALERRPEIRDLEWQQEALDRQKTVILADGKPQIDLNGYYGRSARLPEDLGDSLFADWRFSLGMSWSFFDGYRRKGKAIQLDSQAEQLRWQQEQLENVVRLEVERSLIEYHTARAALEAAKISAEAAAEASRIARESYQEGVSLQADWIAAQEREIQAEITQVRAEFEARVRAARIARSVARFPGQGWQNTPPQEEEE